MFLIGFVDDIREPAGTMHVALVLSPVAQFREGELATGLMMFAVSAAWPRPSTWPSSWVYNARACVSDIFLTASMRVTNSQKFSG